MKMLIIDDSIFTLSRHTDLVKQAGHEPLQAEGGEKALQMYQELQPEIVLCDIMMPEMDGYEVFEELKRIDPDVFLYFISAEMTEAAQKKAISMEAAGFFQKPIEGDAIQIVLKKYQEMMKTRNEGTINLPDGFTWNENKVTCQKDGSQMAYIPAGIFSMGTEEVYNAKPVHEVYLNDFLMDICTVTNEQYAKFIEDDGYENPKFWSELGWQMREEEGWQKPRYWNNVPWNEKNRPVVGISWFEADAYSRWAGKTLPTEAQWEKAARGGKWLDGDRKAQNANPMPQRKFAWGDEAVNEGDVWRAICKDEPEYGSKAIAPVGLRPQGASCYGCLDMTGNVWEWCADWFKRDYYKTSAPSNPTGPEQGEAKVLRGGSWCREGKQLMISFRTKDVPSSGGWDLSGFRCAKILT